MVGHIEFFRPVAYWDAYELSYKLYGQEHAGQGYTTEAVRLLVDYLFGAKKVNRISLVIVPENASSRRIAERCGFKLEGTARGAFFHGGRSVDVLIYSLLRDDPRPWSKRARLIIRLIIHTIRRDPSGSVQIDAEHLATDLAVGGSNPSRRAQRPSHRPGAICYLSRCPSRPMPYGSSRETIGSSQHWSGER